VVSKTNSEMATFEFWEESMVLASMTGFGRARGELSKCVSASIVARSVNHRYLDIQVRTNVREETPEVDVAVRAEISRVLNRGRVTVQVNIERTTPPEAAVLVNQEAVASVLEQLSSVRDGQAVGVRDVLQIPGLVTVNTAEFMLDASELQALRKVTRLAVEQLQEMRRSEGQRLGEQIRAELAEIRKFVGWFRPQMAEIRDRLRERMIERITEALGEGSTVDPQRIIQEAAVVADRADVAEELVRLESHLDHLEQRLATDGAIGRALDFMCQEVNRELNTLGSKCREIGLAERLVDARTSTERVREQVQNLE